MNSKKLCFFDYNINFGGAPKGSVSLCSALKEHGMNVVIYDAYGANKRYLDFIKDKQVDYRVVLPRAKKIFIGGSNKLKRVISVLLWLPDFFKLVYRLRCLLTDEKVDLVWVNNNKSLVTISIASLGLGVKKALYHRGWAEEDTFDVIFKLFIHWQCDALIGHSYATVNNLKKLFPKQKTHYVPNSVDLNTSCKTVFKKKEERTSFVITLPAARPVKEKGHHTAVQALFKLVKKGIDNIVLQFPGEVSVGVANEYISSLKVTIAELDLSEKVVFLGWKDSLEDVIMESDIVILPSHTEGFPRVIIESMLLGTPVIATPVGGIPEAIEDNQTGLLVNIEEPDMLADKIYSLLTDLQFANKLASNAYDFARVNFSKFRQVEGVTKIFNEVLQDD